MDMIELTILGLTLAAAIAAAVGAWTRRGAGDAETAARRLDEAERRLMDELSRTRETIASAVAAAGHSGAAAQKDLALQLGARLDASTRALGDSLSESQAAQRRELNEAIGALRRTLDETRESVARNFADMASRQGESLASAQKLQDERLARVEAGFREFASSSTKAFAALQEALLKDAREDSERASAASVAFQKTVTESFGALQRTLAGEMERMRADNEAKLEKIRGTVEEKLQSTLETRLGESFRLVSERLEQVQRGLGEMQALATGVGDLKRVLTNVRSRGSLGEVQLATLLEQLMSPGQYEANVATVPGSDKRVEFAIRLPGREEGDHPVMLPIDAKFPQEDYLRLMDAYDAADPARVEEARRALRARVLDEADKIATKYLHPPDTTDFAILFFPTEGLYAEALRMDGLIEEVQRRRVTLTGPTTLYALLNSFRMGFQTLAIEKQSSEVWRVLGAIKTEFGKFGDALDAVEKKLSEAATKVEDAKRRSRAMGRKMKEVEALPAAEAQQVLPAPSGDEE